MKIPLYIMLSGLTSSAIVYWPVSYSELSMMDKSNWLVLGLISIIITMLLSRFFIRQKKILLALYFSLGATLAILLRIQYDTITIDSSSHNLALIEILIVFFQSFPAALLGAYLGKFIGRKSK